MSDDLRDAVKQNTSNIKDLSNDMKEMSLAVTRVATMVEGAEKRHLEDKDTMRQVFERLNELTNKVASSSGTDEKVSAMLRELVELKSDFRALNNDCKAAFNTLNILPVHAQKILALEVKIEAIETWRDKLEGGAAATGKIVGSAWTVLAGGGAAAIYWLFEKFGGGGNGGY